MFFKKRQERRTKEVARKSKELAEKVYGSLDFCLCRDIKKVDWPEVYKKAKDFREKLWEMKAPQYFKSKGVEVFQQLPEDEIIIYDGENFHRDNANLWYSVDEKEKEKALRRYKVRKEYESYEDMLLDAMIIFIEMAREDAKKLMMENDEETPQN